MPSPDPHERPPLIGQEKTMCKKLKWDLVLPGINWRRIIVRVICLIAAAVMVRVCWKAIHTPPDYGRMAPPTEENR